MFADVDNCFFTYWSQLGSQLGSFGVLGGLRLWKMALIVWFQYCFVDGHFSQLHAERTLRGDPRAMLLRPSKFPTSSGLHPFLQSSTPRSLRHISSSVSSPSSKLLGSASARARAAATATAAAATIAAAPAPTPAPASLVPFQVQTSS